MRLRMSGVVSLQPSLSIKYVITVNRGFICPLTCIGQLMDSLSGAYCCA